MSVPFLQRSFKHESTQRKAGVTHISVRTTVNDRKGPFVSKSVNQNTLCLKKHPRWFL